MRNRGSGVEWLRQQILAGCLTEGEARIIDTLKDIEANIEWGRNVYHEIESFQWYRELHDMRIACLKALKMERR